MEKILFFLKKYFPRQLFRRLSPAYHFLLNWLGALIYQHPSDKLIVIGVTGTTGKTSSVYLIAKVLENAGYRVGYTSTAMFNDGRREWLNDKKMTMVGRFFTQKILADMVKNGCQYALVETTSEGVRQFRHRFINFDILVFTGLYPEHIESHGSYEKYKQAKGELFKHLHRCRTKYIDEQKKVQAVKRGIQKLNYERVKKTIIANFDDAEAEYFFSFFAEQKIGYTTELYHEHDEELGLDLDWRRGIELIKSANITTGNFGTEFDLLLLSNFFVSPEDNLNSVHLSLKLLGAFNVANAMTAVAVGLSQGLSLSRVKKSLEPIKGIVGRLELINAGQDFAVIVDYAFEPRALEKLYEAIKLIPHQRIIHVLGATGGGRDQDRRPILGEMAGRHADLVIVTNEDPYDDDPLAIIEAVAIGAERAGKRLGVNLLKIPDRREAINLAIFSAKTDDLVLITGKGSEQFICLAQGEKMPWDDRLVAKEEIKKLCG